MKVLRIDEPDTLEERELKDRLADLQRSYMRDAQPIIDQLVRIHNLKLPKMLMVPDDDPRESISAGSLKF